MKIRNVLIFRDTLLGISETFILAQGEGLSRYKAFYFGSKKADGIEVPADRSHCINDRSRFGRCREILFKAFGWTMPNEWKIMRNVQPVLIHAHFGLDGVLALPLARTSKLPLVVTFHGFDVTTKDGYAEKSYYVHKKYLRNRKILFNECSTIIAVSEFIKQKLLEQGAPEHTIIVHNIGIDLKKFQPLPHVIRKDIVLFVGRLVEVKGCSFLLRAMREIQGAFPEAELVVIGDGPLREQLENEAEQTLKQFRFLGNQPPHIVREWMNQAKIFSVPSITTESGNAEGFGIVFAEAQAMGVPVVSFASGGIPEAVADGETGLLSPERDWRGLAANIKRLLEDEDLWQSMSRRAQERVRVRFNLESQTRILENIYTAVLGT